jgi:hypothetical protein
MTPEDLAMLNPPALMKLAEEHGIFFLRDNGADYPSADEQRMLPEAVQRRFVSGCFGYVRFENFTFATAVTSPTESPTESQKQELVSRCGAGLMNQIAKRIIDRNGGTNGNAINIPPDAGQIITP